MPISGSSLMLVALKNASTGSPGTHVTSFCSGRNFHGIEWLTVAEKCTRIGLARIASERAS